MQIAMGLPDAVQEGLHSRTCSLSAVEQSPSDRNADLKMQGQARQGNGHSTREAPPDRLKLLKGADVALVTAAKSCICFDGGVFTESHGTFGCWCYFEAGIYFFFIWYGRLPSRSV